MLFPPAKYKMRLQDCTDQMPNFFAKTLEKWKFWQCTSDRMVSYQMKFCRVNKMLDWQVPTYDICDIRFLVKNRVYSRKADSATPVRSVLVSIKTLAKTANMRMLVSQEPLAHVEIIWLAILDLRVPFRIRG